MAAAASFACRTGGGVSSPVAVELSFSEVVEFALSRPAQHAQHWVLHPDDAKCMSTLEL